MLIFIFFIAIENNQNFVYTECPNLLEHLISLVFDDTDNEWTILWAFFTIFWLMLAYQI